MVQVLPYVPSFGERLVPALAEAGSSIAQGVQKRNAMNALKQLFTPMQQSQVGMGAASPVGNLMQQGGQPQPQTPIERIIQNPSLGNVLAAQQVFENAIPGSGQLLGQFAGQSNKANLKEQADVRSENRALIKEFNTPFFKGVGDYREKSPDVERALNAEIDAIVNGEVDPFSSGHIAQIGKDYGLPPSLLAPLETVGSKEFRTGQKTFLTSTFKDAFRGATTQGQIELASSLLSETGAPREANLASVYFLQSQHMVEKEKVRLTEESISQGISPEKIPSYVNKKLDDYAKFINDQYFIELKNLREEAKKK